MKNLHLMPMNSFFDDDLVGAINYHFPKEENVFFHKAERTKLKNVENSFVVPEAFTPEYINDHESEYDRIFVHSLFLGTNELVRLSDTSAKKMVWIVWGHDLYSVPRKKKWSLSIFLHEAVHCLKMVLRGTYIRAWKTEKLAARKVGLFHAIGICFPYDEVMIRKKYGKNVPVVYGPIISPPNQKENVNMYRAHIAAESPTINILLGHSGFEFIEHEKYLKKLSKYKDKDIHVFLILSYGASDERIRNLTKLAHELIGKDKCTVITEMMPRKDYYELISTMNIAIFPFKHQSALGNTIRLANIRVKLYFHPKGVLAKGFREGGVKTYDCRKIGRIPYNKFIEPAEKVNLKAPLYQVFNYQKCVDAWKSLLS